MLFSIIVAAPVRVARDVHSVASGTNNARTVVADRMGRLYAAYSGHDLSNYQIYIAYSIDGGATWDPTWATITTSALDDLSPSMAIDSNDTLHVVWRGNISTGTDADLLYTKYPNPSITTICAHSGYPGTNCPSIAVDSNDDLHVAWTGCPSAWRVRYMHYDRGTGTWDPPEDIGTRTPSRWPSIEVDSANRPHIVYRNSFSSHYHCAHRYKESGAWVGFNGEDHDTLDILPASVEYSSVFIDPAGNLHAVWEWMAAFSSNPDSVRYRKYNILSTSWLPIYTPFGNGPADVHTVYNGDVVVDDMNDVYIFYHDNNSLYCNVSRDGGATFTLDTLLSNDGRARYPNARGSNFPAFNRPVFPCVDYVWTWNDPDSAVVSLMFDRLCLEPEEEPETTFVCAHFGEPAESSWTSCEDQSITAFIGCCNSGDTLKVFSSDTTVEYFDSTTSSWLPALYLNPTPWGTYWIHLDSSDWVWSEYPASYNHGDWFRSIIDFDCDDIDTAFIRIQCDNKGYIYANGTYVDTTHGNSGGGSAGWRTLYEFDLTPYFHGGADTVTIRGYNSGGIAGMMFEIGIICRGACCGAIDESTIDFTLNGDHYSPADPELFWDGDSTLVFTPIPPDTFENGDTIVACVEYAEDTCAGALDTAVCRSFFVDLSPPVIWGIEPPPGSTVPDTFPDIYFDLFDSLSGLDTSSIAVSVSSTGETPFTLIWTGTEWHLEWNLSTGWWWGDTVTICVTATDTTDYCPDNILDTCWRFYIQPCRPLDIWVDCPLPCYSYSSCTTGAVVFGISDTAGRGIDTTMAYFTVIRYFHAMAETLFLESPSPYIIFDFATDSTISVWGNWVDGDSVSVSLDSIFSPDGCVTEP